MLLAPLPRQIFEKEPAMATYRVDLRVDGDHLEYLDGNLQPVELGPEDTLVVGFAGMPPSCIPALSALKGGAPFGPFLTVQVEGSTLCCQGCGHIGDATFEVWPLLVGPDVLRIGPASPFEVRLVAGIVHHVRQIHLTLLGDEQVVVAPGHTERIYDESVVEWLFHFADPNHPPRVPVIVFERGEDTKVLVDSGLGPFSALRVNTFGTTAGTRFRIIGSGNNGVAGKYYYSIGVIDPIHPVRGFKKLGAVSRDGQVIDPIIDNTGGPP
jgi:hypothetical protein